MALTVTDKSTYITEAEKRRIIKAAEYMIAGTDFMFVECEIDYSNGRGFTAKGPFLALSFFPDVQG